MVISNFPSLISHSSSTNILGSNESGFFSEYAPMKPKMTSLLMMNPSRTHDHPLPPFVFFFFLDFIYLFMRDREIEREREREAETQAEGEAGSLQGARRGT